MRWTLFVEQLGTIADPLATHVGSCCRRLVVVLLYHRTLRWFGLFGLLVYHSSDAVLCPDTVLVLSEVHVTITIFVFAVFVVFAVLLLALIPSAGAAPGRRYVRSKGLLGRPREAALRFLVVWSALSGTGTAREY